MSPSDSSPGVSIATNALNLAPRCASLWERDVDLALTVPGAVLVGASSRAP
jgi:hypothetical protein